MELCPCCCCRRLEGRVETGRRQWGGIWSAPRAGSIVRYGPEVTTHMVSRFSDWESGRHQIENRLPWINTGYFTRHQQLHYVFTTTADDGFWGTLISRAGVGFRHSPWLHGHASDSGNVLYWIRENE